MALVSGAPARAVTVEDYQKWRLLDRTWRATPTSILEVRLLGVFRGLVLANRVLRARGAAPLFCPPDGTEVGGRELRKWVDEEVKSPSVRGGEPYPPNTQIEALVLAIAVRAWPCRAQDTPDKAPSPDQPE